MNIKVFIDEIEMKKIQFKLFLRYDLMNNKKGVIYI